MKIKFLILMLLFSIVTFAQTDTTSVLVKKSDLTREQIQKIETNKTVETVSQWVGLGKEIGVAMNEGLISLTQNAVNFSETDLGQYTMILIGWKVLGKDVTNVFLKIFIVLPIWICLISILIWMYRRGCLPKRYLIKKTLSGRHFWIFIKYDKEWEVHNTDVDSSVKAGYNLAYGFGIVILTGILTAIML